MAKVIVYSENHVDFKYQQIVMNLDIEYRKFKYSEFIFYLLRNIYRKLTSDSKTFYHIRYLKWRGYFFTVPVYVILILLCWVKGIKITWTCHNVLEHKFRSRLQNWFLRYFVYCFSDAVVVMHKDLIKYLPRFQRDKVKVANFGDLRPYFENMTTENEHFRESFRRWKEETGRDKIDLLYVSTAKIELTPLVKRLNGNSDKTVCIIAPGNVFQVKCENIFLYTEDIVRSEIKEILTSYGVIGLVLHDNISVPTSIYMFASYRIPVLCYDIEPLNSIVQEYQIGKLFNELSNIEEIVDELKTHYDYYRQQTIKFLEANSWDKAAAAHKEIWR